MLLSPMFPKPVFEAAFAAAFAAMVGRFCNACTGVVSCAAAADAPPWYPTIAATSAAHISSYWPSVAAIAGAFCPNRFDITNDTKSERLPATVTGCTVAAKADSNSLATAWACVAAPEACVAAALNHPAYGAAAAAMAWDAGPCHPWAANPEVTEENDSAAESSSEASPFQAAAAESIGAEPAPENINHELTSGGNVMKLIVPPRSYARPLRRTQLY